MPPVRGDAWIPLPCLGRCIQTVLCCTTGCLGTGAWVDTQRVVCPSSGRQKRVTVYRGLLKPACSYRCCLAPSLYVPRSFPPTWMCRFDKKEIYVGPLPSPFPLPIPRASRPCKTPLTLFFLPPPPFRRLPTAKAASPSPLPIHTPTFTATPGNQSLRCTMILR